MNRNILLSFFMVFVCFLTTKAQISKYSIGVFSDIMLEAPTYDTFYGINGKYDLNNHSGIQVFGGYSNVHMTTVGADYIYNIKDQTKSNFNIYGGIGLSGDFYKQKIVVESEDKKISGYAKKNYVAINPTIGVSYRFDPVKSTVFAGYKVKYYPFEDAMDINYLSVGIRYHL
ncbi:outer membrane beta-barrel protein [Sphingobacterium faecium]